MKYLLLSLLLLSAVGMHAQKFEITGKITDAVDSAPLESATVYVQKAADSSLVTYTISEKSGDFTLSGNTTDSKLIFFVSYNGYQPYRRQVDIKSNSVLSLGEIKLKVADNSLGEITLTGTRPPVVIKQDTLEFNAASFNTRQDANLEELMKKLPGVEVDTQGNITVNGKPVSRILVNGKEFFGNDPKIATKNLPKEIIDKIQVTDTKTKSEEFTGKAGNPDDKTINITIQKDKNKGYFARATAGGGTDDRYELSGIGNYFKDKLRVSVLASSNNINSSGFSFDEVFDMMGRNARSISFNSNGSFGINGNSFGANEGITKAETAGINFVDGWGKKAELTADYFYGRNNTDTRTTINRENILPDGSFFYNSTSSSNLINDSNRANVRVEITPDTLTRISIAPQFSSNSGNSHRYKSAVSLNEMGEAVNSTTTSDNEDLLSRNFSNRLNAIRKFGSRGAYLELNISNTNKSQANDDFFYSESQVAGDLNIQDQYINEDQSNDEYSVGVTQRFVLKDKLFLDASYDFTTTGARNSRLVYNRDVNGTYTDLNS
ncbi:MAG: carboxypeptidase regulatory-like domain-containing protein [Gillisia sp.]